MCLSPAPLDINKICNVPASASSRKTRESFTFGGRFLDRWFIDFCGDTDIAGIKSPALTVQICQSSQHCQNRGPSFPPTRHVMTDEAWERAMIFDHPTTSLLVPPTERVNVEKLDYSRYPTFDQIRHLMYVKHAIISSSSRQPICRRASGCSG